ncbi:ABC transporter substrate-binding protein [Rhizobium halophilum]|uniref:ABC transporter substrate-binding protein n=1 Tax=Rhizobium halophilum TaxID=2846852 RepID=UPI001EFCFF33|nr:ABC transporter substrate-binding protein [Rhizobium halophilum]MCF6371143.1 ABC transporter substrate-binding protein [Rhizobium halophilum]
MLKFVALAGSLILATCAQANARMIVDDGGRDVEIPDTITRVMPAGPPASVLVYVLSPEKLVSWTHELTESDKQMLLPSTRTLPASPKLAVAKDNLDVGALLATRPDVIVDVGTVNNAYISRANEVQERTGIPYILIDGSLRRTSYSLRQLGAILNVSPRAEELARYADSRFADFRDGLAAMGGASRLAVYYGRGPDGLQTPPSASLNGELLDLAGANNVAPVEETEGLLQVTPDQVREWNPSIILAGSPIFAYQLQHDEKWAKLDAVKNGRVYRVPAGPFGWIESPPSVNRLLGLVWLKCLLYPNVFRVELASEARSFYSLFYHVDLTQAQLDEVLQVPGSRTPSCD